MGSLRRTPRRIAYPPKAAIDNAIASVLESGQCVLGSEVAAFEREFADYHGAQHAVAVVSGTDVLHLSLRACGIGPGDSALTVSHTEVATAAAILLCDAAPVFVYIDSDGYVMDPGQLEIAIKGLGAGRLRAVVPVHLYGRPADMETIRGISSPYGLRVVEDCAQSHRASFRGRRAGTPGHIAAFSSTLRETGAMGDGGMVVTDYPSLRRRSGCFTSTAGRSGMLARFRATTAASMKSRSPFFVPSFRTLTSATPPGRNSPGFTIRVWRTSAWCCLRYILSRSKCIINT